MNESSIPPAGSVPRSTPETIASDSTEANTRASSTVTPATESTPHISPTSVQLGGGGSGRPPGAGFGGGGDDGSGDDEEEQMTKMSFLDHLEELRQRIINSLIYVAGGFGICFWFAPWILDQLMRPIIRAQHTVNVTMAAEYAKKHLELPGNLLIQEGLNYKHPADIFNIYIQIGLICGLFAASPFVLYQVWGFISPGLYKREKKYVVPFVTICSTLFIMGGAFGYFVAFPFALEFLLGMSSSTLRPVIMADEYLNLFSVIILGLGLIFEMPVLILVLTTLRIVTPKFLLDNFRYAILIITIIAAVVTPTTDIPNMMMMGVPMVALYLLGVFFSMLVVRKREQNRAK